MHNETHLYDLSFVSPNTRRRTKPQIVFTIKERHLDELRDRLRRIVSRYEEHAKSYCGSNVLFALPSPDLFGNTELGYGRCGLVIFDGMDAHLSFELAEGARLRCCTMSMHVLTQALFIPMQNDDNASNQLQQIYLEVMCSNTHGHPLSGYVSPRLTSWLRRQGERAPEGNYDVPAPAEVIQAMREAWHAVAEEEDKQYANECRGKITRDGRFMLACFGDACDVAIYPDEVHGGISRAPVRFNCHNLDSASQQVTLIAGIAKLCELARANEHAE